MVAAEFINPRRMRYTKAAMTSMVAGNLHPKPIAVSSKDLIEQEPFASREWGHRDSTLCPPCVTEHLVRNIGRYPLTSNFAGWLKQTFSTYVPSGDTLDLVQPFAAELHQVFERERIHSSGLHDLNLLELVYQVTLEAAGAILVAAARDHDVRDVQIEYHTSRAARDEHLASWGKLLTGLICDPPIISMFPLYLGWCQAFGLETRTTQENYVYAALAGIDWVRGNNAYSDRFAAFEKRAFAAVPGLEDDHSGDDRCFWRVALAYLDAVNKTEHARSFTAPHHSYITTDMDHDLLIATRGIDTISYAYMCTDGAAYFDSPGMDSAIASAIPNDVMDLHTDIVTRETRNLIRLLYPNGQGIEQAMKTMSTVLSGMLCDLFRGHKRARLGGREDGRVAATSPPYSFCRARHRRIFEVMEIYIGMYPKFWEWTWHIYDEAKRQVTEAGLDELLVDALKRAVTQGELPESTPTKFFHEYYDMMEQGGKQSQAKQALGVSGKLGGIIREINSLWHGQLLNVDKKPGWGVEFDELSDSLLGQAGDILSSKDDNDDFYRFSIAYGRLSMAVPYLAYHTIDAIILSYGVLSLKQEHCGT